MAKILSETRSTSGSPYVYYTVSATTSNRTANSIDVKVTVTSRLANSSSTLGSGENYGIRGFIEIEDIEYELILKKKADSWSGTTKHSVSKTITVDTLTASQTLLENIKFRAIRTSGNTANAGYLKATSCKDIEIPIGHTPPSDVTYTITELNQKLINAGITDNLFVENLSEKQFDISATLHDDADVSKYSIYNYFQVYSSQTTPIIVDFSVDDLFAGNGERDMVYIRARVDDTLGGSTWSGNPYNTFDTYNYIPYSKVNLVETSTSVKRNGQTSGKVKLNVNGNYYNSDVGIIDQTNYKPTVKYKFWKNGGEEPSTYDYTIPSENIVVENGKFSVSNYEIGSSVETDINWFNPDNAYKVKIYVEDNFTSYESQEKPIAVGEATWTEYKDRVDFKRITIKGVDVVAGSGGSSEGGTTNYNELTNKPSINGVTLSGSKTLDDLNIQPKGNYLTSIPSQYITENELNAKGYLTSYEETDPSVPSHVKNITSDDITTWNNKSEFSGSYNDLTNKPTIPTKTSQLTNDEHYIKTSVQNPNASLTTIYYDDTQNRIVAEGIETNTLANIEDIPTVPTKVSAFTNDAGYLTEHQDLSGKQDKLVSGTNIKTINNQSLLGSGNITISSGSGGTSDYNSLENIPSINNVTLVGNKTLNDLGIQAKGNYALSSDIPTKTSELTNDSGFLTQHQDISGKQDKLTAGDNIIIENNVISAITERINVLIEFENSNYSGGCLYYPATGLCFIRLYITGKAFATGSRHIVATIPEIYRPNNRTALSIEGLQDYSGILKASIDSTGEIGFTTSVAKESGDDIYISGVWYAS